MNELNVDEPQLARRRKAPRRFEQGEAPGEFAATPKMNIDECTLKHLILQLLAFVTERFKIFTNVQQLLFKACSTEQSFSEELDVVCDFFCNDFSKEDLSAQLLTLRELHHSIVKDENQLIVVRKHYYHFTQRMLLNSTCKFLSYC